MINIYSGVIVGLFTIIFITSLMSMIGSLLYENYALKRRVAQLEKELKLQKGK